MKPSLKIAIAFLDNIGLPVQVGDACGGFTRGVRIEDGRLVASPSARPSTLLHEAGHLAVLPGRFRHLADGRLSAVFKAIAEGTDWSDPDSPECVAAMQCSDPEATAWAWAAGSLLGLAANEIVADHEYGGDGAAIRAMLSSNAYAGINGLARARWCAVRPGPFSVASGLPPYPLLTRWLQL